MPARTPVVRLLLAATLAATTSLAVAQAGIYKSRDAQGNVIFSDQPVTGSEAVSLPPTNTMDEVVPPPAQAPAGDAAAARPYNTLAIMSPLDGQYVYSGTGSLDVSIAVEPGLQPGHRLRLLLDGAPSGFPAGGSLKLEGVSRGPHTLQAQVLNADGDVVQSSGTVSVQFQRPLPHRVIPGALPPH